MPASISRPLSGGITQRVAPQSRRRDHLLDDLTGDRRVLLEVLAQTLANDGLDRTLDLAVAELGLGLPLELRVLHLDRDDRDQTLAHILATKRLWAQHRMHTVLHHHAAGDPGRTYQIIGGPRGNFPQA